MRDLGKYGFQGPETLPSHRPARVLALRMAGHVGPAMGLATRDLLLRQRE